MLSVNLIQFNHWLINRIQNISHRCNQRYFLNSELFYYQLYRSEITRDRCFLLCIMIIIVVQNVKMMAMVLRHRVIYFVCDAVLSRLAQILFICDHYLLF